MDVPVLAEPVRQPQLPRVQAAVRRPTINVVIVRLHADSLSTASNNRRLPNSIYPDETAQGPDRNGILRPALTPSRS
jgi:hypothetical protein